MLDNCKQLTIDSTIRQKQSISGYKDAQVIHYEIFIYAIS